MRFHGGTSVQYLVNYDLIKINKLVKHEILIHFEFNINLLLKMGKNRKVESEKE